MSKIELAMINSYKILTGKNTFDELVIEKEIWLAHDNRKDISEVDFDLIIEYFKDLEDYEKCGELNKLKLKQI